MKAKNEIRERVWKALEKEGVALFPGARGRIPNFRGADKAAHLLSTLPEWQRARNIKANPDSPQRPVRYLALTSGKMVYMAVPRLREERRFTIDAASCRRSVIGTIFGILAIDDTSYTTFKDSTRNNKQQDSILCPTRL